MKTSIFLILSCFSSVILNAQDFNMYSKYPETKKPISQYSQPTYNYNYAVAKNQADKQALAQLYLDSSRIATASENWYKVIYYSNTANYIMGARIMNAELNLSRANLELQNYKEAKVHLEYICASGDADFSAIVKLCDDSIAAIESRSSRAISSNVISQNSSLGQLSDLDAKNGFKDFKLGDSYSKWAPYLGNIKKGLNDTLATYTGSCCQTVFEYSVRKIVLQFENKKLTGISISLVPFSQESNTDYQLNKLINYFKGLFGNFTALDRAPANSPQNIPISTYHWKAKKVLLTVLTYYKDFKIGYETEIFITNNTGGSGF